VQPNEHDGSPRHATSAPLLPPPPPPKQMLPEDAQAAFAAASAALVAELRAQGLDTASLVGGRATGCAAGNGQRRRGVRTLVTPRLPLL
jgi:hypothetical protein